jgi:hypothetical protein
MTTTTDKEPEEEKMQLDEPAAYGVERELMPGVCW